eukprot:12993341-Alexandrium_andersonii.AAC.1
MCVAQKLAVCPKPIAHTETGSSETRHAWILETPNLPTTAPCCVNAVPNASLNKHGFTGFTNEAGGCHREVANEVGMERLVAIVVGEAFESKE